MRLYKIYEDLSDWKAKNTECENLLSLPSGTTLNYCDPESPEQVENPASSDFEKYLFPVFEADHPWTTISLFDPSELVPWNDDWNIPLE